MIGNIILTLHHFQMLTDAYKEEKQVKTLINQDIQYNPLHTHVPNDWGSLYQRNSNNFHSVPDCSWDVLLCVKKNVCPLYAANQNINVRDINIKYATQRQSLSNCISLLHFLRRVRRGLAEQGSEIQVIQ